jgi:beta-N-acetylhexosaminidase
MTDRLPAIFGISGLALSDAERAFFREAHPAGYILFARNIEHKEQVRALTDTLRSLSGLDGLPILVDQEGGRVARLASPEWPSYPTAAHLSAAYPTDPQVALQCVELNFEALALDLAEIGITVDCAPVLDLRLPGAHDIIGDRAFSEKPADVAALGAAVLRGLEAGGVAGVIKHIPGHGRALLDSHKALPRVTASAAELLTDAEPFKALASQALMAMTAHIVYDAWDADSCATLSPTVVEEIIRGQIGFDGLLMSDDLDMKALDGSIPTLGSQAIAAGCDVILNCWAKMDDMQGLAEHLPTLSGAALQRWQRVVHMLRPSVGTAALRTRQQTLAARRDALLSHR